MTKTLLETQRVISLDKITFHPNNFNRHSPAHVDTLTSSLDEYDQYKPVIVWRDPDNGVLYCIAGEGLVRAAGQRGDEEIVVNDRSDLSREKAMALMVADNFTPSNDYDFEVLSGILAAMDDPTDVPGVDQKLLQKILVETEGDNEVDYDELWQGMPEFEQDDISSFRRLIVHFASPDDVSAFANLLDQKITESTKWLWYPKLQKANLKNLEYRDES